MVTHLDTTAYHRVFALDTQMVFEARPLAQLDWASIAGAPILLLVLPQVSAEVDGRKRDGRLGQRARDFNRLLEPSIESGGAAVLIEAPVRVDLAYVASGRIDWEQLDDLERDNGDDRIVAQALHAQIDDPTRIEILSFDSRPRAAARRHGLRALRPDDSWLLAPEPSPAERRITELEQRVRLLQTNEPQLRAAIRMLSEPPLIRYRVPPLPAEMIQPVARMVLAQNPREHTGDIMTVGIHTNSDYDEEYDDYSAALVATDIPNIHLGVARQYSQYGFELRIENYGALAAEHLTVELRSGNSILHADPYLVDVFGPPPPSVESDLYTRIPNLAHQLARPDRTSFVVEESEDDDVQIEYRCEDFRHGRTQALTGVIELADRTGEAAHIEARLTASNLRGDVVERLVVPVVEQERPLSELVDLEQLQFREVPPIGDLLIPLLQNDRDAIGRYRNDGSVRD